MNPLNEKLKRETALFFPLHFSHLVRLFFLVWGGGWLLSKLNADDLDF